ncbi:hypothetical protein J6590_023591 [Homalodisca vitripennis]|nr:hypothetical protein J6590_023591 [Homalodisca vitripennis]
MVLSLKRNRSGVNQDTNWSERAATSGKLRRSRNGGQNCANTGGVNGSLSLSAARCVSERDLHDILAEHVGHSCEAITHATHAYVRQSPPLCLLSSPAHRGV